jgi:predicted  nucleic acid-binding Zn-ribbon protein
MATCANCELAVRRHAKMTAKLEHEHMEETSGLNREKEQLRSELARSVQQVQELGASATAAQQRVAALEQEQKGWRERTEAAQQQVRNG